MRMVVFSHLNAAGMSTVKDKIIDDDSKYSGEVDAEGRPHGFGKQVWNDGCESLGLFEHGGLNGIAKCRWQDGYEQIEMWNGDKRTGLGRIVFSSGNVRDGDYVDDEQHGYFIEISKAGHETIGRCIGDLRQGMILHIDRSGKKVALEFKDDVLLSSSKCLSSASRLCHKRIRYQVQRPSSNARLH